MNKKIVFPAIAVIAVTLIAWFALNSKVPDSVPSTEMAGDAYERDYSVSIGPKNAKVTLVEFFDPACEACRAFYPFVKQILDRHPDDVRLVLRYAAFHEGSDTVIRMLEIARKQNVYVSVLESLLKDQQSWASHHQPDINQAWLIAANAGLDVEKAKEELNSAWLDAILKQEAEDLRALKIRQTPTFFVNRKPLEEFGPQQLYALISSELSN